VSKTRLVFVLAVAAGALAACGGHAVTPAGTPEPSPGPSAAASATPAANPTSSSVPIQFKASKVGSKYINVTKQQGNRRVYILRADSESGEYSGLNTARSNFANPHVTFFGEHGKRLVADAPLGTAVEKERTVLMSGGVKARSQDGMRLSSDTLRYDDQTQIVHGEGNVDIVFPEGEELRGQAVDWNLRTGHMDVTGAR